MHQNVKRMRVRILPSAFGLLGLVGLLGLLYTDDAVIDAATVVVAVGYHQCTFSNDASLQVFLKCASCL
jgi:hypothetical protein